MHMVADPSYFRSFEDQLTEGLDEATRGPVLKVLDRQRESLLEESANVSSSSFTQYNTLCRKIFIKLCL